MKNNKYDNDNDDNYNNYEKELRLLNNKISKTKSSLDRKNSIKSMNACLSQIGLSNL